LSISLNYQYKNNIIFIVFYNFIYYMINRSIQTKNNNIFKDIFIMYVNDEVSIIYAVILHIIENLNYELLIILNVQL